MDRWRPLLVLTLLILIPFLGPAVLPADADETPRIHPELWPTSASPLPADPELEAAVEEILAGMSVEEKVGQVLQPSITDVSPEDVRTYHLGSVLNGGGGWPGDVREAEPAEWLALADAFWEASMDTSDGHAAIPAIWGTDAVHGHNNIVGATLFPHNVGLGATRDPALLEDIGRVTAAEMSVTGIDWNFSPTVAVARDDRWGRAYESYSEDPKVVRILAAAMIEGLQGAPGVEGFLGPQRVVATAKHFIGDGGTDRGIDQGDNLASERDLIDIHLAGYRGALASGAQAVMASYSSWHGDKLHGHHALLTDVLRGRMGFDGMVVGDWNGHGQLPGCSNDSCSDAFNAGVDMFMVPEDWKGLYENTLAQAQDGTIPAERLDEAVRRILRVKMRAGMFDAPKPSERELGGDFALLGSAEHREVARRAVRGSLVLLKNDGAVLPVSPGAHVLVAGDGAHDIGKQSGGWTLSWQGTENDNDDFPGATSIWQGIRSAVEAAGGRATLSEDGSFDAADAPDVAIVVYGEDPYAEFEGDRQSVLYHGPEDLEILSQLGGAGVPVVSVFLSGRPLWVNPHLNASDAFVAAWLPGSEGGGVADLLFTDGDGNVVHDFTGRLAFSWPRLPTQAVLNAGEPGYDPLFPLGYGLNYASQRPLPELEVDVEGATPTTGNVYFDAAAAAGEPPASPWTWSAPGAGSGLELRTLEAGEHPGARVFDWSAGDGAAVELSGGEAMDLTREANGNLTLGFDLRVSERPEAPFYLGVGCGEGCSGDLEVSELTGQLPEGEWVNVRIRLRCFEEAGADLSKIDAPVRMLSEGPAEIAVARVQILPPAGPPTCP